MDIGLVSCENDAHKATRSHLIYLQSIGFGTNEQDLQSRLQLPRESSETVSHW